MRSDLAKRAEYVLRRVARRMGLDLIEDDGTLTISGAEGLRYRAFCGVPGSASAMRVVDGLIPLEWVRGGDQDLVDGIGISLALAAAELGVGPPDAMTHKGTFRIHFNRHGAAPMVWCVATDQWELAVASITIVGAEVRTVYRAKSTPDDEDGKPSAWLEVTGVLVVAGGEARICEAPADWWRRR